MNFSVVQCTEAGLLLLQKEKRKKKRIFFCGTASVRGCQRTLSSSGRGCACNVPRAYWVVREVVVRLIEWRSGNSNSAPPSGAGFFFFISAQSDLHWNDEASYVHENE
jgi:hypothetical protein